MRKNCLILFLLLFSTFSFSQTPFLVLLQKTDAFCTTGSASISMFGGTAPFTIKWSNGDTLYSITNLAAGVYTVEVKDGTNKDTVISFTIDRLICDVGIANHFTPNGDDFNDTWVITNTHNYPNFELVVFNRWGQTVHQQVQKYIPWDGKSLGINLADATYYYIFYFDRGSKDKILKGDVSILR